ncbi:CRISPR system precrRNA processing endoribonuclease RAMP protein Cas6 [Marininema halotolerans]|uniref:CRISPR-associated endoribonuclease Cas6 n=1 Tax=Marininema halotolerans TaxID=1155944 RepID=A0A1I6SE22_9BACL|nr:CRISPR system precrRNA processing endoribonuclease RAMP protein Cas6 [Marininema halotolerans]SFS75174.1 CRISPR-associated endoribonuclease Cas6 [Marininema halotolerans]
MYSLRLNISSTDVPKDQWVLSRRFHAFIFHSIQRQDPQLSEWLHSRKERQLFGTYLSFKTGDFFVRTPIKEIVQCLQQSLLSQMSIDLKSWSTRIQRMTCERITSEELLSKVSSKITFDFLTPTTFYQWGNYFPMPDLQRLFSSGLKSFQLTDNQGIGWQEIEPLIKELRVENLSVSTERVDFGSFKVIGFRGTLAFTTKFLSLEDQRRLWLLASYGSMIGFGYKTAWGLGQTKLRELSTIRDDQTLDTNKKAFTKGG